MLFRSEPEREAEFDVTLRAGGEVGEDRIAKVLGAPPTILCASPAYLQKSGAIPATPEDLERHELLMPDAGAGPIQVLRLANGARRAELSLRPKLAVNDPALLHAAVAAGLGIGLLPEFLCRAGIAAQKLKRVLPDWTPPEQAPLCAIYPAALAEDQRVLALVDFLAANVVPALKG